MPDVPPRKIAALVEVAGCDQAQVDRSKDLKQTRSRRLRDIADRACRQFGIIGRVQVKRLVQEQRDRLAVDGGQLRRKPFELLGFPYKAGVHDERIQADEAPAGGLKTPAVLAED